MIIVTFVPQVWAAGNSHWVTAYYAGWELGDGADGYLPVSDVDFRAFTDVIDFAIVPDPDGSLDTTSNTISSEGTRALIKAAHAAGTKALICIGGAGTEQDFLGATDAGRLETFVNNLIEFMKSYGFDGIDIDWEPIDPADSHQFTSLARSLFDELSKMPGDPVLTTTCSDGNQEIMSSDQKYFAQINIMTYDMSFPSAGWVVWFNSPIYNGGMKFPGLDAYLPSIDQIVKGFEKAGVDPGKLGIGAEFGGTVWNGVTFPGQLLSNLSSIRYDVPLFSPDGAGILQKYFKQSCYHWDAEAQAGYLSIPGLLGLRGTFISYDYANSIAAKAAYIK